ncbi:hypothetical protein [Clostridium akagii]|uniref:hypothetical protein n=1 Tax=Clostridium akagii TaxID=91623 RepID=UPI00047EB753|nr:hypothetical protein [Clostridium akagii]
MVDIYKFTLINTDSSLNLKNIKDEIDGVLEDMIAGKNKKKPVFKDVIDLTIIDLQKSFVKIEAKTISGDTTWRRNFGQKLKKKVSQNYLSSDDEHRMFKPRIEN